MNKNWYVVYTKSQCEKKVAALLTKRKIENFCPLNKIVSYKGNKKRMALEPLFPSFVFVYSTEHQLSLVRQIGCVVNFVYWKANPAVISQAEIEGMHHFTSHQLNIKLEKSAVGANGTARLISDSHIDYNNANNMISIKNSVIKLLLPSLGYILMAETGKSMIDVVNYEFERSEMLVG
jgi:transcription antitermination factor NusG